VSDGLREVTDTDCRAPARLARAENDLRAR
jgi:hypothetical protein